ncbi:MAG: hypothetical protein AB7P40_10220 [Chloroflexota bacterium]
MRAFWTWAANIVNTDLYTAGGRRFTVVCVHRLHGITVVPEESSKRRLIPPEDFDCILALGEAATRLHPRQAVDAGVSPYTAAHGTAIVSRFLAETAARD